ncbi:MAG: hypothetical protein O3A63_16520 [Proteobacteria bacterium]|nr:hypothetical protein [Pseudomonadota bacterium]
MYFNNRLSRITHPRSTPIAMILLFVVFLGFGIWAQAHDSADATRTVEQQPIEAPVLQRLARN